MRLMLLLSLLFESSVLIIALPMVFYASGMGLVLPNSMAVALRPFPHIAGTASALLGFIQMSLSASATAFAGVVLDDTPKPMIYSMFILTVGALLLFGTLRRYHRSAQSGLVEPKPT